MTCLIVIFIRKFRFVLRVCHWSYILISAQRSLCPCAQLLSSPVVNFTCFLHLLLPIMDVWFVPRKTMVTSAEQGDVSFLMNQKHCFRLPFQPCLGHSVLFQEKCLYFAHGCSHPISFVGLGAVIRNLYFLLQFRAAQWEICFVGNSQNPDLTAQIKMLI